MNIISQRNRVTCKDFHHEFLTNRVGSTYAFDCTESGELIMADEFTQEQRNTKTERLAQAMAGEIDGRKVRYVGIKCRNREYTEPAVGVCDCGCKVVLDRFTNTCECGADYNMSGQRLADRSQWGEETGEHWSECM